MEKLLPDQLQALWKAVDHKQLTPEEFTAAQDRLIGEHQQTWAHALLRNGYHDLHASILSELGLYMHCDDMAEVQRCCEQAVATLKGQWHDQVHASDPRSIERFYDQSKDTIYELMWWHTLGEDTTPLAYVVALHFAQQHGCTHYLDFGSGVGAGGILFARHGLTVTLADISSTLLGFSKWRLKQRALPASYLDLKTQTFPHQAYDFVTAMDVFEHLVEPEVTVEQLWHAIRPGGFLYARIASEVDEDRPQHIAQDFTTTFNLMRELGFVEVWKDEWLWGHQVFQKV